MMEYSLEYAQQRASDFQAEAEKHTLIRQALADGDPRMPFYAPLLAGVGRTIGALGARLEHRYTECVSEAVDMLAAPRAEVPRWN